MRPRDALKDVVGDSKRRRYPPRPLALNQCGLLRIAVYRQRSDRRDWYTTRRPPGQASYARRAVGRKGASAVRHFFETTKNSKPTMGNFKFGPDARCTGCRP